MPESAAVNTGNKNHVLRDWIVNKILLNRNASQRTEQREVDDGTHDVRLKMRSNSDQVRAESVEFESLLVE